MPLLFVERLTLIVALLIVTLVVNVILGIELYYALHKPSQPIAESLNISGLQIITSSTTSPLPSLTSSTISSASTTQPLYNFSFKVKFKLHLREKGVYIIGIKPNITFASLYVLIYFDDGNTVILTLNHTMANVTFDEKEIKAIVFIQGSIYQNLTPEEIFQDLGLYVKFVSPIK